MADYIYNPAESIKQSFQQASAGIGNIFTQVIAQQQRDYNLAESAFQNIEALKKDVNIFGQKNITSKSNDLLKQAGSAILKDGKLDYSKLGEIRQSISEIKDLKAGYDVGAKEYERMLQLGIANKDNLVSFEKFYKELSAKMADENLVKNPQDLQKAMADTYTNNLDSFKMFGKSYLGANPYQKIAQDIKDPKTGALMRVQAELPAGWTVDAQGNRVPLPPKTVVVNGQTVTMDYVDQELARLKSTNPDMLELMKKQAGFAGQTISERDLVKAAIDRVPTTVQASQLKSKEELKSQEYQVDKLKFDVENQGRVLESQLASQAASRASSLASAEYYKTQAGMLAGGASSPVSMYSDTLYDGDAKKNVNYSAFPLYKETATDIKLLGGKQVRGFVSDVAIGENGAIYAKLGVGGVNKRIVNKEGNVTNHQYHKVSPDAVPAFFRDMKLAAKQSGDKNIVREALDNIRKIELAHSQYKPKRNTGAEPKPTKPNSIKPSGKFITKAALKTMYGEGKPYGSEQEAANAAINTYGHTVEGYND